jgi:photosynthesis system II assembly factor YCF48-like protein/putative zinc finger protein
MTELPDRLLRDALRPGAPAASNVCVDADALAAWADGTMSSAARASFESHAADCARCQALMAAMARTEPPSVEPAWWPRSLFTWLIPLAAATAAIVVVVSLAVTERGAPSAPAAREQSTDATPSHIEAAPAARAAAPSVPASAAPRAPESAAAGSRRNDVPPIARAGEPQMELKDAIGLPSPKTKQGAQVAESTAAASQPPAAPLAAPVQTPPASVAPTVAAAKDLAASAPVAAAGATANAESILVRAERRDASRLTANEAMTAKAAMPAALLIASPGRDSQWRIVENTVEHTNDGGATWQTQTLGVDVSVRAGAAPAARVCWLVGARGLVLVTTSGADWRRIEFPESVDLVAIEATDTSHATVTTATGRRFSTADGGKTWIGQ